MHKPTNRLASLVAGLAVAAAACGDDPTGVDSGDQLTAAEVRAVFNALGSSFDSIGVGGTGSAMQRVSAMQGIANAAPAAVPIDQSFDITVPCQSGTIRATGAMSGNLDEQTLESTLTMEFTWKLNGCQVASESTTLTVDSDPDIAFMADLTFTQEQFGMSGTETGGFRFTSADGRSGTCAIDMTFSTTVNIATNEDQTTISGTICGLPAAEVGVEL